MKIELSKAHKYFKSLLCVLLTDSDEYKPNDQVRDQILGWADRGMIQLILELKLSQYMKGHNVLGKSSFLVE